MPGVSSTVCRPPSIMLQSLSNTTHLQRGARLLSGLPWSSTIPRRVSGCASRPFSSANHSRHSSVSVRASMDLLGGLKKVLGQAAPQTAKQQQALHFSDTAPSWDALADMVRAKEQELGVNFTSPNLEQGPTSPQSLKRTFGKDGPIRVKLYRCPYCQKVWFQLEEKQIPYLIEKINMRCYGDKPAEFMAKVPSGLLPVLEVDGRIFTESAVIMALLEDSFPDDKPLLPPRGTQERSRAEALMRLERRFFSDWLNWLCTAWGQEAAQKTFERTMDVVCQELEAAGVGRGPFFMGSELSLVDITFVPMVERAVASLAYYKGCYVRGTGRWPAIERWFDALEQRDTYMGTKSDYFTHSMDLPPQMGGCYMNGGEAVAAQIDGSDASSWRLPLAPLSSTSLPEPYARGDNPAEDCLEAATKMVRNHEAVAKFALRGAGRPGPRPVSAPLSDPTARPALEHMDAMDAALRHVVHAMLVGVEAKQLSPQALQVSEEAKGYDGTPIVPSAEYLRDRVGVPRDMRFPAARQLRAHLNFLIDTLEGR